MLDEKIENLLNGFGEIGMQKIIDMAQVEIFRNYCIHNFNWFKGGVEAHSDQHRYEKTWMRFYIDHGRLPTTINFNDLISKKLTQKDIESKLQDIYNAYIKQHSFDIMKPDIKRKTELMLLEEY